MSVIVRDDLAEAHRLAWAHLAAPGSWWSGAERLELAGTALMAIADADPLPPWVGVTSTDRVGARAARAGAGARPRLPPRPSRRNDDPRPLPRRGGRARRAPVRGALRHRVDRRRRRPLLPQHRRRRAAPASHRPAGRRPTNARSGWRRRSSTGFRWPSRRIRSRRWCRRTRRCRVSTANTWRMADAQYMPSAEMVKPDWSRRPGGLSRAQMELVAARLTKLRDCFY